MTDLPGTAGALALLLIFIATTTYSHRLDREQDRELERLQIERIKLEILQKKMELGPPWLTEEDIEQIKGF